jgi:hypothetical protein
MRPGYPLGAVNVRKGNKHCEFQSNITRKLRCFWLGGGLLDRFGVTSRPTEASHRILAARGREQEKIAKDTVHNISDLQIPRRSFGDE